MGPYIWVRRFDKGRDTFPVTRSFGLDSCVRSGKRSVSAGRWAGGYLY